MASTTPAAKRPRMGPGSEDVARTKPEEGVPSDPVMKKDETSSPALSPLAAAYPVDTKDTVKLSAEDDLSSSDPVTQQHDDLSPIHEQSSPAERSPKAASGQLTPRKRTADIAFPPATTAKREAVVSSSPDEDPIPRLMDVYGPYIQRLIALDAGLNPLLTAKNTKKLQRLLDQIETDSLAVRNHIRFYMQKRRAACATLKNLKVLGSEANPVAK